MEKHLLESYFEKDFPDTLKVNIKVPSTGLHAKGSVFPAAEAVKVTASLITAADVLCAHNTPHLDILLQICDSNYMHFLRPVAVCFQQISGTGRSTKKIDEKGGVGERLSVVRTNESGVSRTILTRAGGARCIHTSGWSSHRSCSLHAARHRRIRGEFCARNRKSEVERCNDL